MSNSAASGIAYVRFVLDHLAITPSALAKKAGISSSTLTRMLNDPDYKFTLSIRTLNKIAEATRLNYVPFLDTKDESAMSFAQVRSMSGIDRDIEFSPNSTPVVGSVCAGLWYERGTPRLSTTRSLSLKMTTDENGSTFALEVRGDGCNMLAKEGEFLICTRIADLAAGRAYVIAERSAADGRFIEVSALLVSKEDDVSTYSRPSTDPEYSEREVSDVNVKLIGVVQHVVRNPVLP